MTLFDDSKSKNGVKEERSDFKVKEEPMEVEDSPAVTQEEETKLNLEKKDSVKEEPVELDQNKVLKRKKDDDLSGLNVEKKGLVKEEPFDVDDYQPKRPKLNSSRLQSKPLFNRQKPKEEKVPALGEIEDGEFPDEPNWMLVGRSTVAGLSTCHGKKLDFNEIVHFVFPSMASTKIVRFSTKRAGEIGRLPIEWKKCIIPLVNASKVKVRGRCVSASLKLSLMQEIHLYVRKTYPLKKNLRCSREGLTIVDKDE